MSYADPNTVKLITQIAEDLPPELQEELLILVGSWKKEVRNARRWHFVELLGFTSEHGTHQGRAKNISSTGIFIETTEPFELGEHLHLLISFMSVPDAVSLYGQISRHTHEGIGVNFDHNIANSNLLNSVIMRQDKVIRGK
ncbi:PilZ domain-containing protein [Mariprofundus sp. NF]|uniref:PilZ domain-containing protein n=1 Tax=Mariprofundus sp. NF TaxID=2608716 RepID=UPI0015A1ADF8|nr:PilZ domain-containing protein [Mariprofundus sp. NF]